MCTHRSRGRERAIRAPKVTHKIKSTCRLRTPAASAEYTAVTEVNASMRIDYKCPVTQGGVNSLRDALLENGLAEEHHWVPNSGWITFQMRSEEDLSHALWLMRLSYLRYALKTASDPAKYLSRKVKRCA